MRARLYHVDLFPFVQYHELMFVFSQNVTAATKTDSVSSFPPWLFTETINTQRLLMHARTRLK